MTKQQKASEILKLLKAEITDTSCPLHHTNAYELLFAVILSAQATDVGVNKATPKLFERYKTLEEFAKADVDELKEYVRTINFYNNKAGNIVKAAQLLVSDFNGQVPDTMEELIKLPGVARKTANVILHHWFHQEIGFIVDTHVLRLAKWFDLTEHTDPVKVEKDLMELFPRAEWGDIAIRMIRLGRSVLTAKNPKHIGTVWEKLVGIS